MSFHIIFYINHVIIKIKNNLFFIPINNHKSTIFKTHRKETTMAKLLESDFYYGAILSTLLNNGICPMLIEGGTDRQVYDFTTDQKDFRMFAKYRSSPINTKTEDYFSWQFIFSDNDINEIKEYLKSEKEFSLVLVCGADSLKQSQYAILKREDIEKLIQQGKKSLTVSRKKGEHDFRISVGGGRENSLRIKANRVY